MCSCCENENNKKEILRKIQEIGKQKENVYENYFLVKEKIESKLLLFLSRVKIKFESILREKDIQGKQGILVFLSMEKKDIKNITAKGTLRYYSFALRSRKNLTIRKAVRSV